MTDHIPFLSPTFPCVEDLAADYAQILLSRRFSNGGPFEQALARGAEDWIGADVGVSLVSSGTMGIDLAVRATFRQRPLAIVASFTFAAGPLVLLARGYQPVFIDIDAASWHPKIEDAREFLEHDHDRVGGILLTATFGVANERIRDWEDLSGQFGLPLVIDSAAGLGSEYASGERAGARGTCEIFSLHATKTVAVGEGGMIASRHRELVHQLEQLKNFGFDATRSTTALGTNGKISELSCAIGLRQLASLEDRLDARRQVFDAYSGGLRELGVMLQPGARRSAQPFVSALLPAGVRRQLLLDRLESAHIEARKYYNPPVHKHPLFTLSNSTRSTLSTTDDVASRIVSLPMHDDLSEDDVVRIVQVCREVLDAESTRSG